MLEMRAFLISSAAGSSLAVSARIMPRYLIDRARHKGSVKFIPIEGPEAIGRKRSPSETAIAIDRLLAELTEQSPELCEAIELTFLLGHNDDEGSQDSRPSPAQLSMALSAGKDMAVPTAE